MQEITPQDAFEEINSGHAAGIDVRESQEWVAGHAERVLWNPMSAFDINALPNDVPMIFICRSGARSEKVASEVAGSRQNVFNMTGGMLVWHAAGLAMVSDTEKPEVA